MSLIDQKKLILKFLFITLMFFVAGTYTYFKMKNLLTGPVLTIVSPQNGATMATSTIVVSGVAKNVASIYLDDRPIPIDEKGNFSEVMALIPGYNILTVRGADKFNKETSSTIELVYKN